VCSSDLPGLDVLEKRTGKPVLGVIPYFRDVTIAQEDSVYLDERQGRSNNGTADVAVIHLPHISNYDDFDPLEEHGCCVRYITRAFELGNPDLIILPGTKSTIADLIYIQQQGLAQAIIRQAKSDTPVIGICGGYQMLGKSIHDPDKIESRQDSIAGLGLLDITTIFNNDKTTTQIKASVIANEGLLKGIKGTEVTGYEIHMGQTRDHKCQPVLQILETPQGKADYLDGAVSSNGLIFGTYIHGLFHNANFTHRLLNKLRQLRGLPTASAISINKQEMYDKLADIIRQNLDMPQVYKLTFGGNDG
jgi:adenosylcobyric acid synthase